MTAEAFDSGKREFPTSLVNSATHRGTEADPSVNATAKYMVKVNATTPTFHYCTVGTHCTAGMFGIVK